MSRTLTNEASPAEQEELYSLLQKNEQLQQQYELLKRLWKEKEDHTSDEENTRQAVVNIINKAETEIDTEKRTRIRRRRRMALITSLSLLIVTAGWIYIIHSRSHEKNSLIASGQDAVKKEVLVAPNSSHPRSTLPDGTTVWLNAGSKLFLENDFAGNTREVRLEGEAYFDVVKKAGQPFIVHTNGIDIRVLGTAFNVKAYPGDKTIETTLYRGLVQVVREKDNTAIPIELKPNEKLIFSRHPELLSKPANKFPSFTPSQVFTIKSIDSTRQENERPETAWVYNRLEFRGDNFEELAAKMERWYNVNIEFDNEKVKQLRFNGSFEHETIKQALEALNTANPFTYKINNNEIFIGSSE